MSADWNLQQASWDESETGTDWLNPGWFDTNDYMNFPAGGGDFDTTNLKAYNMQPWHVFRVNCNVIYNIKC